MTGSSRFYFLHFLEVILLCQRDQMEISFPSFALVLSFPDHPFDFLPSSFPPLCVRMMNDITSSRLHEEATGGFVCWNSAGQEHVVVSREILIPNRLFSFFLFSPFFFFWPSNFRDGHVSADSRRSAVGRGQRPSSSE